jgi:hypothetical protein
MLALRTPHSQIDEGGVAHSGSARLSAPSCTKRHALPFLAAETTCGPSWPRRWPLQATMLAQCTPHPHVARRSPTHTAQRLRRHGLLTPVPSSVVPHAMVDCPQESHTHSLTNSLASTSQVRARPAQCRAKPLHLHWTAPHYSHCVGESSIW